MGSRSARRRHRSSLARRGPAGVGVRDAIGYFRQQERDVLVSSGGGKELDLAIRRLIPLFQKETGDAPARTFGAEDGGVCSFVRKRSRDPIPGRRWRDTA